ncbi:DNA cytosine methyltransferase [Bordetella bronchialis]|uniref:DNA cytosine methyltransferase n=1 Tax=Bordetella bronchialis TaxID=463025 RepID=UPI0009F50624|nr:DNA cytosine methyltransferase [Bordetella bronchialis]
MAAYYNEIDPYAAQWLRNLIAAGHIAPGDVDKRSIEDVHPDDLRSYTQCHFFAGLGAWSYALRRAGWPDDRPVWTGSCPCQPFSAAGKGAGFDDERHLWPAWHHLIAQRRPAVVFGEQVASKDADPWIDLVQDDLEALGYAVGAVPFPSAGVGAPHIRDRLYWVGVAASSRRERRGPQSAHSVPLRSDAPAAGGVEHAACHRREQRGPESSGRRLERRCEPNELVIVDADTGTAAGPVNGPWSAADWLFCRDGKWRPVEPGTFPLAHGAASRVGRLRAYGNAINAFQAQIFIEASMTP